MEYLQESKALMKTAGPLIVSQLLEYLTFQQGVFFCGHLGKTELAAVGLGVTFIIMLGMSVAFGLSSASNTLMSQHFGTGNKKQGIFESFSDAYHLGPEKANIFTNLRTADESCTFANAHANYLQPHEGYDAVFGKEMAYNVWTRRSFIIPEGFTHTFLIRHPAKAVASYAKGFYTCSTNGESGIVNYHRGSALTMKNVGFEEQSLLYFYFCEQTDVRTPLVIDADDLLQEPERMLREYCRRTGLPFGPEMLKWKPTGDGVVKIKEWITPWYQKAPFQTTSFEKMPAEEPSQVDSLPEEVKHLVELCLPFYNNLYERRLRLEDCAPLE